MLMRDERALICTESERERERRREGGRQSVTAVTVQSWLWCCGRRLAGNRWASASFLPRLTLLLLAGLTPRQTGSEEGRN